MKTKIALIILFVILSLLGLVVIGVIGANIAFEEATLYVLSVQYIFLGVMKLAPLILISAFLAIIFKNLNKN